MTIKFTNQSRFNNDLSKLAKKLNISALLVGKKISFDAYRGVTLKTPVDTGRARAGWNINPTKLNDSVPDESFSGGEQAASAENEAKLSSADQQLPTVWYISNALPYIPPLENGHSAQADKGYMIQRTLSEIEATIEKAVRELKL